MSRLEIVILGFGLAMDATAVSISNGMLDCKMKYRKIFLIALCFGLFQGLMPIFGYYFGKTFASHLDAIDNYLVFIILFLLGIRMIIDSYRDSSPQEELTYFKIFIQGFITSIDALMVGVTFAILRVEIYGASFLIALITFSLCLVGVFLGCKFGKILKNNAQILGGIILILVALKILFS